MGYIMAVDVPQWYVKDIRVVFWNEYVGHNGISGRHRHGGDCLWSSMALDSIERWYLTSIGIPFVEIRRSCDRHYPHNGILYTGKATYLYYNISCNRKILVPVIRNHINTCHHICYRTRLSSHFVLYLVLIYFMNESSISLPQKISILNEGMSIFRVIRLL